MGDLHDSELEPDALIFHPDDRSGPRHVITYMFSATFPQAVIHLADQFMQKSRAL
jgi:superfamily II DNA/RNA helicase